MARKPKDPTSTSSGPQMAPKKYMQQGNNAGLPNWWLAKSDEDVVNAVFNKVSDIDLKQDGRKNRNQRCMMLYGNMSSSSTDPNVYTRVTNSLMPDQRVKYNIISSMVDTVCAKISKMKPRVTFLTTKGDFRSQDNSQKLTKYVDGAFYKNDVYNIHQNAFRDASINDIGVIKHYINVNKQIVSERVLANEIYVDEMDALYGQPRSIYQAKVISKEVLKAMYPKQKEAIDLSVSILNNRMATANNDLNDFVVVIEAWHLPSTEGAGDGRRVLCTDKALLENEDFAKPYFPFTFLFWSKPSVGFYGQSLAERLLGNQVEINKMLRIIQRSFHLGSAFKVFLEYGSKVAKDQINNDIGPIIYYSGTAPQFYVPQTVHPEYFQHLDRLIRMSYQEAGVSEMSASSKVPAGIDGGSGKAIREYNNLETERFVLVAQMYEQSFLQTAAIYIDLSKDVADMGGDFEVVSASKKFIKSIKWSEIDLPKDAYVMQMFPTNQLPNTPAGRLAYVQELIQAGFVDQETAFSLLEFPDVDEYASLKNAFIDDLKHDLYTILDGKGVPQPEPYQNLAYGTKLFQSAYLRARAENAPEEILDGLRRWLSQADALMQRAKQEQQAQAMAAQQAGMPPQPGQAPQSPDQSQGQQQLPPGAPPLPGAQ